MAELFIAGLIVHLVVDWFLQADWVSANKSSLRHPAAWVHSGLYVLGNLLVFSPLIAVLLGLSHMLLDTRVPLRWWRRLLQQDPQGEDGRLFRMLQDQAAHTLIIGLAAFVSVQ
ncbi:MAG: hypothetical protein WEA61_01400 [Anaerolineales bacterium]